MPTPVKRPSLQRNVPLTRTVRPSVAPQQRLGRLVSRVEHTPANQLVPYPSNTDTGPNPYVDYGRYLTPQGGILIIHKDLDLRFRHSLWRFCAFTLFTGGESLFLLRQPFIANHLMLFWLIFGLLSVINGLIVATPVEVYRKVEVRPDCLIVGGEDIFWLNAMECGWPTFQPKEDGSLVLGGIYGTRFVEYLTIRDFDEFDRGTAVFMSHFQDAMQQLWTRYPA